MSGTASRACFPLPTYPSSHDTGFYSVYLSRGMAVEAASIAEHMAGDALLSRPVTQVYRQADPRGTAAAAELRRLVEARGGVVTDVVMADGTDPGALVLSPDVEQVTGKYFEGRSAGEALPKATDVKLRRKFWDVSAQLTGIAEAADI